MPIKSWTYLIVILAVVAGSVVTAAPTQASVPGMVLGYSFDAGSGSSTVDASGNANTGAVNGAAWNASGRYGGALSFDGVDDTVRVPSSSSLALTAAMTLTAWVKPSAAQAGWRCVIQKEVEAYYLDAGNHNGDLRPAAGAMAGNRMAWTSGTSALGVGVWTHLAATYDGTAVRLFVNGVQRASAAASGTLQQTANPLWIGGNSPYGEYFKGLIDEVRVYNRALSTSELATVMNEPVGAPPADTTPPSAPAGLTATATGSAQINLAWTAATDNAAVAGYGVERCLGTGCTGFAEIARPGGTSFSHTGLPASQTIRYRVRAFDTAGNAGPYSAIAQATTSAAPPGGYPTPDNTGVPAGTSLTAYPGNLVINSPGVHENLDVSGCVEINADNVTLRRSRVGSGGGCPYYVIKSFGRSNILIEDVEVVMTGWETKGIAFDGYTARRVKFSPAPNGQGSDCAHAGSDVVIEDSYCSLAPGGPSSGPHYDGFQSDGGDNIVLRHNTIRNPYGQTSAILMSTNTSPISNVTIDNNLLSGGGWTVYCGTSTGPVGGTFVFTNNRFSREFFPGSGALGPAAYCDGIGSGNVWHDTGLPIG